MAIISMSLDDELLKDIDSLQEKLNFKGRSEVIRVALRLLIDDHKNKCELQGEIDAILLVVHQEKDEDVNKIKHDYQSLILTQVHNHLKNHECLDMFVLRGESKKIKDLYDELLASKAKFVKLIVS